MAPKQLQTITCKGAVVWGPEKEISMEEIQIAPPGPSEVRIKLIYASICHTDVFFWRTPYYPLFPRVLGHEGVGAVESVGEGVEGIGEGDIVIPAAIGECQQCRNCKSGKSNFCLQYPLISKPDLENSKMSLKEGQKLYPFFSCSTFCEFTVVNVNYLVKIDPRIALPHASFLSCGFTTGFGTVWKEAMIEKGSTVAVFGLGAVGIGAVAAAKSLGASKIIGVDVNEWKKDKAMTFGMTDFINSKNLKEKTTAETIREMTSGLGVDYSFLCVGVASLVNEALEATVLGKGVSVNVGGFDEPLQISPAAIGLGRTMKGSIFGGIKPTSDFPTLFSKCLNKEFNLDGLVTHKVDLDNLSSAFELLKKPDCLKILIKFDASEK